MNQKLTSVLLGGAVAALLAGCADAVIPTTPVAASSAAAAREATASVARDRYLVHLAASARDVPGMSRALAAAHGGTIHHTLEGVFHGFSATLPAPAAEALRKNPNVVLVEPVALLSNAAHYEQLSAPWGLDRIDQRALPLDGAYRTYNTGAGAEIYILDTGILPTHQEFGGRASIGYDARPGDSRGGLPYGRDCHGHGTHVAGIAGGATTGVAKHATIIGVKANIDCTKTYNVDDVMAALRWVRDRKLANPSQPMVLNMSVNVIGGTNSTLDNTVQQVISAGVYVVVAAGNGDTNGNAVNACNVSPARVAGAYTVGWTNQNDSRNAISNYGSCLDMFAPGSGILSAGHTGTADYDVQSGTSMAAPFVAGAVAAGLVSTGWTMSTSSGPRLSYTPDVVTNAGTGSPNRLLYTGLDWLPQLVEEWPPCFPWC